MANDPDTAPELILSRLTSQITSFYGPLFGHRVVEADHDDGHAILELDYSHERPWDTLGTSERSSLMLVLAMGAAIAGSTISLDATGNLSPDAVPLATSMSWNFVRYPATSDLRAEARPVHRGRTTMIYETRITDGRGRLINIMTSSHMVLDRGGQPGHVQ